MEGNEVRFPWEEPEDGSAPHRKQQPPTTDEGEPWAEEDASTAGARGGNHAEPWAGTPATEARPSAAAAIEPAGEGDPAGGSARERPIAPREYYSISEVCDLVDLKPHVLRYWETQFGVLSPSKNRSGNRVYQRKEIKLILLVKHLLYEEKFTVEGAKQKLERMRRGGELPAATAGALDRQSIEMLRSELRRLSELLTVPEPA